MDKFKVKADAGKIGVAYDGDADGEDSVKLNITLDEVIQEALKKGQKVEGQAMVDYEFDLSGKLKLKLDTDQDGEPSVELEVSIGEALNESNVLGKIGG